MLKQDIIFSVLKIKLFQLLKSHASFACSNKYSMLKQILVFKVVNDRVMQINVASILVWTMIWEQLFWKVNYYRRVFIYVLLELEVLTDLHNFL